LTSAENYFVVLGEDGDAVKEKSCLLNESKRVGFVSFVGEKSCELKEAKTPLLETNNTITTNTRNIREIGSICFMYPNAPMTRIANIHLMYELLPVKSPLTNVVNESVVPLTPLVNMTKPTMIRANGI
jgi:hypothetical protein